MKVFTDNVFDWATCVLESARLVHEYAGPVLECKGGSPPPAPDPTAVAAAQTSSNENTAAYNNAITHGDTTTPLGSQTYTSHVDPKTGATVYDQNVTLAPAQQQLLNLQNAGSLNLQGTANKLLGQVGSSMGAPEPTLSYNPASLDAAREQVQNALYARNTQYLDPQFQRQQQALQVQLANEGLTPGSQPWQAQMSQFQQGENQAYQGARDNAIIGGGQEMALDQSTAGQQLAQELALRNAPLNQYDALRSSSQVNLPQFQNPTNAQSAPTNVAGIDQNAYQDQLAAWQQQQQSANAGLGGLFGLGAATIGAAGQAGGFNQLFSPLYI